jgi:hypothetical protein
MSRAQRKLVAALGQMRGEATIANPTFKEPDLSAQSAAWTSSAIWQPLSSLANTAAKFKLAQRARASKERAPDFNRVFIRLLNSKYEDHLNKELWDELISFNGDYGVEITEIFEPLRLTWADSEGRSGKLSFRTFENRLATLRGEIGRQKRPRKNSR